MNKFHYSIQKRNITILFLNSVIRIIQNTNYAHLNIKTVRLDMTQQRQEKEADS